MVFMGCMQQDFDVVLVHIYLITLIRGGRCRKYLGIYIARCLRALA